MVIRTTLLASLVFGSVAAAAESAAAPKSIEGEFLSNIRQVTSGFVKAGEGYFSPDGKQIVYQAVSKDYPFYQIYTQPLQAAGTPIPEPRLVSISTRCGGEAGLLTCSGR